jgi:glucose/mannose-6-phosphate isomerase
VIDLDDETAVRAGDPSGMLPTVAALPEHCREGYRLGLAAGRQATTDVSSLALCGMGSSSVAGDVIRALYADRLRVPAVVVRGSELPRFCGRGTLVLVCSYSGDTAEALACFEQAVERGCPVLTVTSGGQLASRGGDLGLASVTIPTGFMPRASLGYTALGALGLLEAAGLLEPLADEVAESIAGLGSIAATCAPSIPTTVNPAKRLASSIGDRVPVLWGSEGLGSVAAMRWKTQLNENAKVPAWASSLPELDHNEVVGWSERAGGRFFVVALRHEGEPPDVAARFPPSMDIARESGAGVEELWASGASPLSRFLSLAMTGDFVSIYLGIARGFDPTPIDAIARLKRALAEA